jgi:hypothetical protein
MGSVHGADTAQWRFRFHANLSLKHFNIVIKEHTTKTEEFLVESGLQAELFLSRHKYPVPYLLVHKAHRHNLATL